MGKVICKDTKKILKKRESKLKYKCKKCGEKAVKEKHLCKPKKL